MDGIAAADTALGEDEPYDIGVKLRLTRRMKGMTLKELSTAASCSESLLSKIENGRANPSLKTLKKLTSALGVTVGHLLSQASYSQSIVMKRASRFALVMDDGQGGNTARFEPLAENTGSHLLESHLFHLPGGSKSEGPVHHDGEELGYVISGSFILIVDGERYTVDEGDSFSFRSERPHSWENISDRMAIVLWVNTPPTF